MDEEQQLRNTLGRLSKDGRNFAEFAVRRLAVKKIKKPPNGDNKPPGVVKKTS